MHLLGISGSLRSGSHNTQLLAAAADRLPEGWTFAMPDLLRDVPPFDVDAEEPAPQPVERVRALIAAADAVLVSTPEYNASIPGQLKNVLDWTSRPFATNVLRNHLLTWMRSTPPSYAVKPVILTCAPGELHEGSLLILGVLLRRLRWHVIYLGQSMPLADLATFVDEVHPSVLVFVAMTEDTGRALVDWYTWLPKVAESGTPLVAFGGRAFNTHPHLAAQVPGVLLGSNLREGIATLDRLLHRLNPLLQ